MKLFFLLFSLLPYNLKAKTITISDIDDTLKVTHVHGSLGQILVRALNSDNYFVGMPYLLSELAKQGPVYYVTNAVHKHQDIMARFKRDYRRFLKKNRFPHGQVYFSPALSDENHKLISMRKIIEREKPNKLIFIGDHGQRDPWYYQQISLEYPEIKFMSFLRILYNERGDTLPQQLFENQKGFATAFEVALELSHEKLFDKKKLDYLYQIISRYSYESKIDYHPAVIADFATCELLDLSYLKGVKKQKWAKKINDYLLRACPDFTPLSVP